MQSSPRGSSRREGERVPAECVNTLTKSLRLAYSLHGLCKGETFGAGFRSEGLFFYKNVYVFWGENSMEGFIAAFALVFCAEMGDKTQLIAMTFAARYSWRPVMAAVLAATLANHGLAVGLGVLLGGLLPEAEMRFCGSVALRLFGIQPVLDGGADVFPRRDGGQNAARRADHRRGAGRMAAGAGRLHFRHAAGGRARRRAGNEASISRFPKNDEKNLRADFSRLRRGGAGGLSFVTAFPRGFFPL